MLIAALTQVTRADAQAELQRLTLLKKHHLDEQYVARRSVRDLPATISILSERVSDLSTDEVTATAHAADPGSKSRQPKPSCQ